MQSRSATPVSRQQLIDIDGLLPRSRSRARPGRRVSLDVKSNEPQPLSRPRSISRFTARLASPARGGVHSNPEKYDSRSETLLPDDYVEKYPKDQRGDELGANARVWRIYTAEAKKADQRLTEECNRSMDVLLVFTGLFSAVLTTFIIQTYQMMVPDETDNSVTQFVDGFQDESHSTKTSSPSERATHWVNGLWFAALACSLSTALISMLAKQWLQAYTPHLSGSPRNRARLRQSKHMKLRAWHVPSIISTLPLLLHIALLLFFAGLIVLLWDADLAITIATLGIIVFAYAFYFVSVLLPLFYDDCPYYHPLTQHIRNAWRTDSKPVRTAQPFNGHARNGSILGARSSSCCLEKSTEEKDQEALDAAGLIWLLTESSDNEVLSAALQSLAGLPNDFSAIRILRDADVLTMIEQAFGACFYRDTTIDLQWHLLYPEAAELYVRAWIHLTRGTAVQWPLGLIDPLGVLQDTDTHPEAAAIASCVVALSSFEAYMPQWELLAYLAKSTAGEIQLSTMAQRCLLDSFIECTVLWEMPAAVIEETRRRAIPTVLRMLHLTSDMPSSEIRTAAALALYVVVQGPVSLSDYRNEDRRRADYCELALESLSVLVTNPERFSIHEPLMSIIAHELCRMAAVVVTQSERIPQQIRYLARSSLSSLYVDGYIAVGIVPDRTLSDVLHVLYPPLIVPEEQRPIFVTMLVETLDVSSHPDITNWCIRLLEFLLTSCTLSVADSFADNNGIDAVLRAAKAGLVDSRRLQIDSLRTLCAYINSATSTFSSGSTSSLLGSIEVSSEVPKDQTDGEGRIGARNLDLIFNSAFFDTLFAVVAERRWWVFEVSAHWMPALVKLCQARPNEDVWKTVIKVFREFAERNIGEDGSTETLVHLDAMTRLCSTLSAAA